MLIWSTISDILFGFGCLFTALIMCIGAGRQPIYTKAADLILMSCMFFVGVFSMFTAGVSFGKYMVGH